MIDRNDGQTGSGITYQVHIKDGWLDVVHKTADGDEFYGGREDEPIDGIRACRDDGKPLTLTAHMNDGRWLAPTVFTKDTMEGENPANDGYAGEVHSGKFIDALKIEGGAIRVAVAGKPYYGWVQDGKSDSGEDWAGDEIGSNNPIVAVQMRA